MNSIGRSQNFTRTRSYTRTHMIIIYIYIYIYIRAYINIYIYIYAHNSDWTLYLDLKNVSSRTSKKWHDRIPNNYLGVGSAHYIIRFRKEWSEQSTCICCLPPKRKGNNMCRINFARSGSSKPILWDYVLRWFVPKNVVLESHGLESHLPY
jgi:hypothetical protein